MALTMTRTRTATALNDLASRLAEVNGELKFLADLGGLPEGRQELATLRREELLRLRQALFVVIKRYDEALEPEDIGATFSWMKAFGRKTMPRAVGRYFDARRSSVNTE